MLGIIHFFRNRTFKDQHDCGGFYLYPRNPYHTLIRLFD
jgi:hypothetical protein